MEHGTGEDVEHDALWGFLQRGPAARSTRAELLGD